MSIADKEFYLDLQAKYFEERGKLSLDPNLRINLDGYSWTSESPHVLCGLAVQPIANESLRIIGGETNMFHHQIRSCRAWKTVFDNLSEDDKIDVFIWCIKNEFIPLLLAPYALKQRFLFFSSHVLHLTMKHISQGWGEENLKEFIENDVLDKFDESNFGKLSALKSSLRLIDSDDYITATKNYRRRLQHRDPVNIEYGFSTFVSRSYDKSTKNASYGLGGTPPLKMDTILTESEKQLGYMFSAYNALIDLYKEVEDIWGRTISSGGSA